MALTLQRKLELAGALSKVQPELRRLHLVPPKKRHRLRNAFLFVTVVVAVVAVVAAALRRRGGGIDPLPEPDGEAQIGFSEVEPADAESEENYSGDK